MKRTSLYTSVLCALLLGTNVHALSHIQENGALAYEENCSGAEQAYVCLDEQYALLEQEFNAFWQQEQVLDEELNQLFAAVDETPDNWQKDHLFEKAGHLYEQAEAHYQQSEEVELDKEALHEKFAELEAQFDELYRLLDQAEDEASLAELEAELKAKLEHLEQESLELDMKMLDLAYKQLDKLVPVLALKEDFIAVVQEYLEQGHVGQDDREHGEQEPHELPEIDQDIAFSHTGHCFGQDDAVACLRAVRQEAGIRSRELDARGQALEAEIADLEEQHLELELAGYRLNETGEATFAEIDLLWQEKEELHDLAFAYFLFIEELAYEQEEISHELRELSECLRFCDDDEANREAMQQAYDELYAKRVEIKATVIEVKIIINDLQQNANEHMQQLIEQGETLLAGGMEIPETIDEPGDGNEEDAGDEENEAGDEEDDGEEATDGAG
ncbi:hypothetical protein SG34_016960 [Thalassomonas viridans]|uniref:Chromosome segregation ATPase n=1 Tax=Thalassomonas viridans TaxID=137584 RepID=A0AAE9YY11_9GAMM|nr:hypothetical protein [Thalassomonas viridans]WDE03100.1 hypothetical protein SG34_016960 [Thalassomonas viridans]